MTETDSDILECDVFNGDKLVGTLTRYADCDHFTEFTYDLDYHGPALSRALPRTGKSISSKGLHPFFCNLISEGWLEEAQKKRIEQGSAPTRFELLAYFGNDCIGSLRVVSQTPLSKTTVADIKHISEKLANKVNALIPGVQPKVLATYNPQTGNYVVSNGNRNSTHIAKLPHTNKDFQGILENEFVTTTLVQALMPEDISSKIDLASIVLLSQDHEESNIRIAPALLIKRFDRTEDNHRLEMYEFNQLLGKTTEEKYQGSYKEMADFIRTHSNELPSNGIKTNLADIEILFKRILVSLLVENADTHLKNFALMRANKDEEFRLTPNYDLVSCSRYKEYSNLALAIGATDSLPLPNLKPKHIVQLASDFGILSAKPTVEEARHLSEIINNIGNQLKRLKSIIEKPMGESPYPDLEKTAKNGYLKGVLKDIYGSATKRWNGTFAHVDFFLAKKIVNLPEPVTPASKNFTLPPPTIKNG